MRILFSVLAISRKRLLHTLHPKMNIICIENAFLWSEMQANTASKQLFQFCFRSCVKTEGVSYISSVEFPLWLSSVREAAAEKETPAFIQQEMLSWLDNASLSPSQASLLHSCTLSKTHLCQSIWSHQIQGFVESCAALPLCDSTDLSESAVVQRCNRTSWWSQHANDCDHMRFLTQCLWKSEISQARAFMNSNYWEH